MGVASGGNAADGDWHLSTYVWVVALGAVGLPPGPTLGVTGRLVAYTVWPEGGTLMGEADGKMVPSPFGDCSPVAVADEVPLEVIVPVGGEVAVTADMGTTALATGLDGAC